MVVLNWIVLVVRLCND